MGILSHCEAAQLQNQTSFVQTELTEARTRSGGVSLGLGRPRALMWAAAGNTETPTSIKRVTSETCRLFKYHSKARFLPGRLGL